MIIVDREMIKNKCQYMVTHFPYSDKQTVFLGKNPHFLDTGCFAANQLQA